MAGWTDLNERMNSFRCGRYQRSSSQTWVTHYLQLLETLRNRFGPGIDLSLTLSSQTTTIFITFSEVCDQIISYLFSVFILQSTQMRRAPLASFLVGKLQQLNMQFLWCIFFGVVVTNNVAWKTCRKSSFLQHNSTEQDADCLGPVKKDENPLDYRVFRAIWAESLAEFREMYKTDFKYDYNVSAFAYKGFTQVFLISLQISRYLWYLYRAFSLVCLVLIYKILQYIIMARVRA